jgi:hypothetical protein
MSLGPLFERHQGYDRFLDLLADPEMLRVYRNCVIERPEFQAAACPVDSSEIFTRALREHERRTRHPPVLEPAVVGGAETERTPGAATRRA